MGIFQALEKIKEMVPNIGKSATVSRMRKHLLTASLILLIAISALGAGPDQLLTSLRPAGYVNDFAGVMNASDRTAVTRILTELKQKSGAEISVVSLTSLDGGQIDDFATRLFERWGIGQKGKDNGILLLAAMKERRVRIEVGYGLEGALPDAAAGRLIDQYIVPAFRKGDYSGGLKNGALALASIAAQEAGVELTGVPTFQVRQERRGFSLFQLLFLLFFIPFAIHHPFLAMMLLSGGRGGYRGGGGFSGGSFGGFGGGMSGGGGASRGW